MHRLTLPVPVQPIKNAYDYTPYQPL